MYSSIKHQKFDKAMHTYRLAIGLHLKHCEVEVDEFPTHQLSCRKNEGLYYHHSSTSDSLHCTIPAILGPFGPLSFTWEKA